jgi:ubiquinone/menaquinone biosynthesis C-methylase UbiE
MEYSLENAIKFKWSSINGNLNSERLSHLKKYLKGHKILDAGCGGGAYVNFLDQNGFQVTGIDNHEEFIGIAKNNYSERLFLNGDLTKLPFPDKVFDCTYCFDVLEHIDDELAIKELARVTKSRLILAVPKEDDVMKNFGLTFLHYQDKTHLRNYTESTLRNLVDCIKVSNVHIFPELSIPSIYLVREMIDTGDSKTGFNHIYKKIFGLIILAGLNLARYKKIYTSLVAIIDLNE